MLFFLIIHYCISLFCVLLVVSTSGMMNLVTNSTNITYQTFISFPNCASDFAFKGLKVDSNLRMVRSEIECAHLCKGHDECSAYNHVKKVDPSSLGRSNLCELLENSAESCSDLEVRPMSKFKYSIQISMKNASDEIANSEVTSKVNTLTTLTSSWTGVKTTTPSIETTTEDVETTSTDRKTTVDMETTMAVKKITTASLETTMAAKETTTTGMKITSVGMETTTDDVKTTGADKETTTTVGVETTSTGVETTSMGTKKIMAPTEITTAGVETTTSDVKITTQDVETTMTPEETTTMHVETTTSGVKVTTQDMETTMTSEETTTMHVETTTSVVKFTTQDVETTMTLEETTTMHVETTTPDVKITTQDVETTMTPEETTTMHVETTTSDVKITTQDVETTMTSEETTTSARETTAVTAAVEETTTNISNDTCAEKWTLVYSYGDKGSTWGTLDDLRKVLKAGVSIAILATDTSRSRTYITAGYEFDVTPDEICVFLPWFVLTESWSKVGTGAEWIFSVVCTTGKAETYSAEKPTTATTSVPTEWYYRPNTCSVDPSACSGQNDVLTNLQDGTISQGSIDTFRNHIAHGCTVSVINHDTNKRQGNTIDDMSDNWIVYLDQTVIMRDREKTVGALNLWSFSKKNAKSDPFLDLTLSSTDGQDNTVSWSLQKHRTENSFHKNKATHSWLVDPCWKLLYRNGLNQDSSSTASSFGSHEELLSAVSSGHRVRVTITEDGQTLYAEADHIVITKEDVVVVQVLSNVVTKEMSFDREGLWSWYFIHSTGVQCNHQVVISEAKEFSSRCEKVETSWFIDTRHHDVILETDVGGNIVSGSKEELRQAVKEMNEIRIKVVLPSDGGMARYLRVDTIELGEEPEVSVLSMRTLATTFDVNGYMRLHSSTQGVALLVMSTGSVQTGYWTVGSLLTNSFHEESAHVTWFVSK